MSDQPPVIYWVRRDLRVSDNQALLAASCEGASVIPVYFLSQWKSEHDWTGSKRQHFLCECLKSLAGNLDTLGARLIIRHEDVLNGLRRLIEEHGAKILHYQCDPDPYGKRVEQKVEKLCRDYGIECHAHFEVAMHHPEQLLTKEDKPYRVYTPFSKRWLDLDKERPAGKPKSLSTPKDVKSEELPTLRHWGMELGQVDLLEAGEKAARMRLRKTMNGIVQHYADTRDLPAQDATSRLSQDLRFGLLSIRTIHQEAVIAASNANQAGQNNILKFIKELAWREFYIAILHHFPEVLEHEFNPDWRGLPWEQPGENFELWKQGRTGFPIVDAGMHELLATGYMHNRPRMITAMFLTKDLHIDWRLGESFFMQHLIDGEIANNNGGWQWSAGTGADAAPYFRIQNPWSQTKRYDPAGEYIKKWVPELADVDPKLLLDPPEDGRPIADDYPLPCVDHKEERERTMKIFKKHKEQQR